MVPDNDDIAEALADSDKAANFFEQVKTCRREIPEEGVLRERIQLVLEHYKQRDIRSAANAVCIVLKRQGCECERRGPCSTFKHSGDNSFSNVYQRQMKHLKCLHSALGQKHFICGERLFTARGTAINKKSHTYLDMFTSTVISSELADRALIEHYAAANV